VEVLFEKRCGAGDACTILPQMCLVPTVYGHEADCSPARASFLCVRDFDRYAPSPLPWTEGGRGGSKVVSRGRLRWNMYS